MLNGEKINLRLFREGDLDAFIELDVRFAERGDFPDMRFRPPALERKSFQDTGWWEKHSGRMAVVDKQDRLLGYVAFFQGGPRYNRGYEVRYVIFRQEDRGRGYATEALRLFSAYLFALKPIERLQVETEKGDAASRRVAEKVGYKYEGTQRKVRFTRRQYVDGELFSLLRDEHQTLKDLLKG